MIELDEVIALLEADIPANPSSQKNDRLARSLELDISKYFRGLEKLVPMEELINIYFRNVKQE